MTVKELRTLLESFSDTMPVVIPGTGSQSGGYNDAVSVGLVRLCRGTSFLKYCPAEDMPSDTEKLVMLAIE